MNLNNQKILLIIIAITIITIPLVYFTGGGFRIAFSLIVLLFCPGYSLLAALLPGCSEIKLLERIALSLGVSIAVVSVIGLILHYTPFGLGLNSVHITTTVFILIAAIIGWYRAGRIKQEKEHAESAGLFYHWQRLKRLPRTDRVLTVTLMAIIVVCIGIFCYVVFTPTQGEHYTEFYILDAQGTTVDYPDEVIIGESLQFTVGVVSHEENPTVYRIEVIMNGIEVNSVVTGIIGQNEQWHDVISFIPEQAGSDQKVELWLYKQGETQPYNEDSLHFYINVSGAG